MARPWRLSKPPNRQASSRAGNKQTRALTHTQKGAKTTSPRELANTETSGAQQRGQTGAIQFGRPPRDSRRRRAFVLRFLIKLALERQRRLIQFTSAVLGSPVVGSALPEVRVSMLQTYSAEVACLVLSWPARLARLDGASHGFS